jgi:RNA polymerase sigma-70 factor, ECF subfamily
MAEPLAPRPRPQLRLLAGGAPAAEPAYTDPELFEGIAQGDERVAATLYRRLLPDIEAALLSILQRRDAKHDELVQLSFERMLLVISRRRYAEACNLSTWASAVAAQVALATLRARRRRQLLRSRLGSGTPGVRVQSVERRSMQRRGVEWLRSSVVRLRPARAEAVLLHDLLGLPIAEIATMSRLSLAATQSRLVRAHKDLTLSLLEQRWLEDGSARPKLPDLEDLFTAWRAEARERARSNSISKGGSRVVARALRLVARRRRRTRQLSAVALVAVTVLTLLGVGFGIWFAQRRLSMDEERPPPEPHVLIGGVLGEVSISDRDGRSASGFASLAEGYGLRTDDGSARLGFTSGAAVSVAHHSRLAILSTRDREVFFLGMGSVEIDLPDLALGGSFAVETPDTHLTSRAAQFAVEVTPGQGPTSTHVVVKTGRVSLRYAGHDLELQAGQSWPESILPALDPRD